MLKRRFFAKLLLIFVSLFIVGTIAISYYLRAFSSESITHALPKDNNKADIPIPDALAKIFNDPLSYLGEGNQAYAFLSSDGQFVVKFFKQAPLQTSMWISYLPAFNFVESWKIKQEARGKRKFDRLFKAYDIAYRLDCDHCGLLWAHLHQTSHLNKSAVVSDGLGMYHRLNLDDSAYVIQKFGVPLHRLIKQHLSNGDVQGAANSFKLVIEMYLDEYQRGIIDHDHNLMHNVGFANDKPIRLDVGKLDLDPAYTQRDIYLADLDKVVNIRIAKWLKRYAKANSEEIMAELQVYLKKSS
jgi:hypothetical protein